MGIHELISKILERPELYLGRGSVQRSYAFLGGYLTAIYPQDADFDHDFNVYVAERYKIKSSHNWASIIEFYSTCERQEMILFRENYEDFMRSRIGRTGDGPLPGE